MSAAAHPHWTPSPDALDALELLGLGLLAPLTGYEKPETGRPTLTLAVTQPVGDAARGAGTLDLLDPEGVTLATVRVVDTYDLDEQNVGVVGEVGQVAQREYGPFRRYHLGPDQLGHDPAKSLAVVVRRPLTDADLDDIREAAEARPVVLLAFAGHGTPIGVTAPALIRATLAAVPDLRSRDVDATVVAAAVPDLHDDELNEFVEQAVAGSYADEALRLGPPRGSLPPAVATIVDRDQPTSGHRGLVLFFTGLSGSGKSTLARAVLDELLERGDRTVTSLDGDVVRHLLSKGLGFSREDRELNIVRIGFVAAEVARHGGVAICSPIAPFASTRGTARAMTTEAGGEFVLIHVATPLEESERRDRKGLYARARTGEIPEFTGISSPYEEPSDADVVIDTTGRDIADCRDEIMRYLETGGLCTR